MGEPVDPAVHRRHSSTRNLLDDDVVLTPLVGNGEVVDELLGDNSGDQQHQAQGTLSNGGQILTPSRHQQQWEQEWVEVRKPP